MEGGRVPENQGHVALRGGVFRDFKHVGDEVELIRYKQVVSKG